MTTTCVWQGNWYYEGKYALGVARSTSLMGPYEKATEPLLKTSANLSNPFAGPGHASVLQTEEGDYYVLYHAWVRDRQGRPIYERGRQMLRDRISWTPDGWPIGGNAGEPTFSSHVPTARSRDVPWHSIPPKEEKRHTPRSSAA